MRINYITITITIVVLGALLWVAITFAGEPNNPPGPPETTPLYRLEDIYNRLATGATGNKTTFSEPTNGPDVGTGHTLAEIMALAPVVDEANGAKQGAVLAGKNVWGLTSGEWGPLTGAMVDNGAIVITPTTTNQMIGEGYHDGLGYVAGDSDLVAGNIKSGVNIFGVTGDPNVVDTSSGDALEKEVALGKKVWVDGSELTGTGIISGVQTLVATTGQTQTYASGDDGALKMGALWPIPRFITGTTGVVTDTLTGLVWLQDANCIQTRYPGFDTDDTAGDGRVTWTNALTFVLGINAGVYANCGAGFSDWRLPNVREIQSLVHYGFVDPAVPNTAGTGQWTNNDPFIAVQSNHPPYYWSSTTYIYDPSKAWYVSMYSGYVNNYYLKTDTFYVWPVRGGQ